MKNLFWILLLILGICPQTVSSAICFVQITDPHVFDNYSTNNDLKNNREMLKAFIGAINESNLAHHYSFVALTGDFGLENVPFNELEKKANEFSEIIKHCVVTNWLIVPGNNDLLKEHPVNISSYHEFVSKLGTALTNKFEVVDLCPPVGGANLFPYSTNKAWVRNHLAFIGFNNGSFKNNNDGNQARANAVVQREYIRQVSNIVTDPGVKYAYIFYHIPEADDPFLGGLSPKHPKAMTMHAQKTIARDGDALSAWLVEPEVRADWSNLVQNAKVMGLFAGHFHSSDTNDYLAYPSLERPKLYVCPPIASKNQLNMTPQARGYREVCLDESTGQVATKIIWLTLKKPFSWKWMSWIGIAILVVLVLRLLFGSGKRGAYSY